MRTWQLGLLFALLFIGLSGAATADGGMSDSTTTSSSSTTPTETESSAAWDPGQGCRPQCFEDG